MADEALAVAIGLDTAQFEAAIRQAQAVFKQALGLIASDAEKAGSDLARAFAKLDIRSLAKIQDESDKVREAFQLISESSEVTAEDVNRASKAMQEQLAKLAMEAKDVASVNLDSAFSTLKVKSLEQLEAEAVKVREAFQTIATSANASAENVARAAEAMQARLAKLATEMRDIASVKLDNAFSTLGIRSFEQIEAESEKVRQAFATISSSATATSADVARAADVMQQQLAKLATEMRDMADLKLDAAFSTLGIRSLEQIEAQIAQVNAAFQTISTSADASAADVERASDAMQARIARLAAEMREIASVKLDTAFSTLGIRSLEQIEAEAVKVREAFQTIATGANVTAGDVTRATEAMEAQLERLASEARAVADIKLGDPFATLGTRSLASINAEIEEVKAAFRTIATSADATSAEVTRAAEAMHVRLAELGNDIRGVSEARFDFARPIAELMAFSAAFEAVHASIEGFRKILDTGMEFEALQAKLQVVTGSSAGAAKEWDYLRDLANRLGLEVMSLGKAFSGFAAATKGTNLEGEQTHKIFSDIAQGAAALKLPMADVEGIMLALEQMVSKGTIQMQELKEQLGNRLPGAVPLFARALGMTTLQMEKMISAGEVLSVENLPKLAEAIRSMSEDALPGMTHTLQAQINLFKNTVTDMLIEIAHSGLFEMLIAKFQDVLNITKAMEADGSLNHYAKEIGNDISSMVTSLYNAGVFIIKWHNEILLAFGSIAAIKLGGLVLEAAAVVNGLATLARTAGIASVALMALPFARLIGMAAAIGGVVYGVDKLATGLDAAKTPAEQLQMELDAIGHTDFSKIAEDTATIFNYNLASMTDGYRQSMKDWEGMDKAWQTGFVNVSTERGKKMAVLNQQLLTGEQALDEQLQKLGFQKNALEDGYTQQSIRRDQEHIGASKTAGLSILANEKAVMAQIAEDAIRTANTRVRVAGEYSSEVTRVTRDLTNLEKTAANQSQQAWKESGERRKLDNQQAVLTIEKQEHDLKVSKEAMKDAIVEQERELVAETDKAATERYKIIKENSDKISGLAKQEAEARAKATSDMVAVDLAKFQQGTAEKTAAMAIGIQNSITQAKAGYDKQLAEYQTFMGQFSHVLDGNTKLNDAYRNLRDSVREGVQAIINENQLMVTAIKQTLDQYEKELDTHATRVASLEKQMTDNLKTIADIKFDIKLSNMGDAEKYNALVQRGTELVTEMAKVKADAAIKGNQADDSVIKKQQELFDSATSVARQIESMGKDGPDAIVKKSNADAAAIQLLDAASAQSSGILQDGVTKERAAMTGLSDSITKMKTALQETTDLMEKLSEVKLDYPNIFDVESLQTAFTNIQKIVTDNKLHVDVDTQGAMDRLRTEMNNVHTQSVHTVQPNMTEFDAAMQRARDTQTGSVHTVRPDTAAVDAALERLRNSNTSSTHTVYVQQVQTNAQGGLIGLKLAGGGAPSWGNAQPIAGIVHGPGSETSDSIPAMLSRGEFVVRAAAVRKWGTDFMHAINAGMMPSIPLPRYAAGGLVAGNAQSGGQGGHGQMSYGDKTRNTGWMAVRYSNRARIGVNLLAPYQDAKRIEATLFVPYGDASSSSKNSNAITARIVFPWNTRTAFSTQTTIPWRLLNQVGDSQVLVWDNQARKEIRSR